MVGRAWDRDAFNAGNCRGARLYRHQQRSSARSARGRRPRRIDVLRGENRKVSLATGGAKTGRGHLLRLAQEWHRFARHCRRRARLPCQQPGRGPMPGGPGWPRPLAFRAHLGRGNMVTRCRPQLDFDSRRPPVFEQRHRRGQHTQADPNAGRAEPCGA